MLKIAWYRDKQFVAPAPSAANSSRGWNMGATSYQGFPLDSNVEYMKYVSELIIF